jgi:hypothetical protein
MSNYNNVSVENKLKEFNEVQHNKCFICKNQMEKPYADVDLEDRNRIEAQLAGEKVIEKYSEAINNLSQT